MEIRCVWIDLEDQCKPVGSGRRLVFAEVGRKWVRLCTQGLHTGRLHKRVFERAVVREQELTSKQVKQLHDTLMWYAMHNTVTAFIERVVDWLEGKK